MSKLISRVIFIIFIAAPCIAFAGGGEKYCLGDPGGKAYPVEEEEEQGYVIVGGRVYQTEEEEEKKEYVIVGDRAYTVESNEPHTEPTTPTPKEDESFLTKAECKKGDLIWASGHDVLKYCDFEKKTIVIGNVRVACYYIGKPRTER